MNKDLPTLIEDLLSDPIKHNVIHFFKPTPLAPKTVDASCLSLRYVCGHRVEYDGRLFKTTEHAIAYARAKAFNATDAMEEILAIDPMTNTTRMFKVPIPHFDRQAWIAMSPPIVYEIYKSKFKRSLKHHKWFVSLPINTVFYHLTTDNVLGIGQSDLSGIMLTDHANWPGENIIGLVLCRLLNDLKIDEYSCISDCA